MCSKLFLVHIKNNLFYCIMNSVEITIHNFCICCQQSPNNTHQHNSYKLNSMCIIGIKQSIFYKLLEKYQNQHKILLYMKNSLCYCK